MVDGGHRAEPRPFRFVLIGPSIVSEFGNPRATLLRPFVAALAAAGHDVTYLELRGNAPYLDLLRTSGSVALRAFNARYERVRHRFYDLPRGSERAVWLSRELATADCAIALLGAPASVVRDLGTLVNRHLIRGIEGQHDVSRDLTVGWLDGGAADVVIGPSATPVVHGRNGGPIVVSYHTGHAQVVDVNAVLGAPLPEVLLDERYATSSVVRLEEIGEGLEAVGRVLLPMRHGCAVIVPSELMLPADLDPLVRRVPTVEPEASERPSIPERYDAGRQVDGLIAAVARLRVDRGFTTI